MPGTESGNAHMVDMERARRWLHDKQIHACPLCKSPDLRVSRDLFVLLGVHNSTRSPDLRRGSRMVRVRCGGCAHVMLFHARKMGLDPK